MKWLAAGVARRAKVTVLLKSRALDASRLLYLMAFPVEVVTPTSGRRVVGIPLRLSVLSRYYDFLPVRRLIRVSALVYVLILYPVALGGSAAV